LNLKAQHQHYAKPVVNREQIMALILLLAISTKPHGNYGTIS